MTTHSKGKFWFGWIISGLCILFLLVDAIMKIAKTAPSMQGSAQLGWPESSVQGIGILLLLCTILYIIPRTAVLGAVLLTGYLGGAIAPGVEISMDALIGRAAALRAVELRPPRNVLGKSTVESIQSGAVYGFAAQVDGLCDLIIGELGECTVLSTGGLADLITPFSRRIQHTEPWLTLHGLRLVYEKNL